ncbi:MAG: leucyl aminopeptidase [bacterium]|jgi:leucyl aminopeptidase|nr:leucyl aminopeptidase [Planctomycetota bacterium]HIL52102.1 leucyl aminopeptidase [Planctomycetota bacterium]
MKFTHKNYSGKLSRTALVVVFACEGARPKLPGGVKLPAAALEDFKGAAQKLRLCDATAGNARRVLLVGLGPREQVDGEIVRRAAARGAKKADAISVANAVFFVDTSCAKLAGGEEAFGCAVAEGAVMGHYRYDGGKSAPKARKLKQACSLSPGTAFKRGVARGVALAEGNLFARDLQNKAGNQMTPTKLAAEARGLARRSPRISCKVIEEAGMKKLGMGLLLGVSAGSSEPAKLIHLVYKPKGKSRGRVAFVGKGLTFDAGGISLKPSRGMEEMRYDMSGSAAVLGAFHALARLDVPFEVHGIVPSSENLADGLATKPGDVHTSMKGTTVEVINTDAEGRLILADALHYTCSKVKPDTIIDLATLTGAVVMGLGHEISGLYSTTDELRDALSAAADACGERVWPMPHIEAFVDNLKEGPADLRNICTPNMGGGSIAGAAFLSQFVEGPAWAHLDIAGTAWNQKARDYTGGKGGTGVGARLLVQYLQDL